MLKPKKDIKKICSKRLQAEKENLRLARTKGPH